MSEDLDRVWKALADPTRRAILDLLRRKPRTTTDIAERIPELSPALGHPIPEVVRDRTEHLVLEDELGASRGRRQAHDQVARNRVGHHERAEYLEQRRGLYRLDEAP